MVCDHYLGGKTIIIQRDGSHNLFHTMTDVINLFVSVLLHKRGATDHDMRNNRILFIDNASDGPFFDIWKLFGGLVRIMNTFNK